MKILCTGFVESKQPEGGLGNIISRYHWSRCENPVPSLWTMEITAILRLGSELLYFSTNNLAKQLRWFIACISDVEIDFIAGFESLNTLLKAVGQVTGRYRLFRPHSCI